jgi:hypothetical protein
MTHDRTGDATGKAEKPETPGTSHAVGVLAVWWVLLLLLYLVLISSISLLEWAVGGSAAAVGAVAALAVRRAVGQRAGGFAHATAACATWPTTLLRETGRLTRLTVRSLVGRPARGSLRTVELRPGVSGAWAAALLSATPGTCVVDASRPPAEETGDRRGAPALLTLHALTGPVSPVEQAVSRKTQP